MVVAHHGALMSTSKRLTAVALIAVSFGLLTAAPSVAHTKRWNSTVSIAVLAPGDPGAREAIGHVASPKAGCEPNRTVSIWSLQDGEDPTLEAETTTDADGLYLVGFNDTAPGDTYSATVERRNLPGAHRHICRGANSGPEGISKI
jgi:hypothetical protein